MYSVSESNVAWLYLIACRSPSHRRGLSIGSRRVSSLNSPAQPSAVFSRPRSRVSFARARTSLRSLRASSDSPSAPSGSSSPSKPPPKPSSAAHRRSPARTVVGSPATAVGGGAVRIGRAMMASPPARRWPTLCPLGCAVAAAEGRTVAAPAASTRAIAMVAPIVAAARTSAVSEAADGRATRRHAPLRCPAHSDVRQPRVTAAAPIPGRASAPPRHSAAAEARAPPVARRQSSVAAVSVQPHLTPESSKPKSGG
eukprot:scaffold44768_cov47-Phaeocystis_antarctica.AAC.2